MSDSFYCRLPWTGFSNDPSGLVRPCCIFDGYISGEDGKPMYVQEHSVKDILTSNFMKTLRQEFRDGRKPKGCGTCWKDEAANKQSKRQLYWRDMDYSLEPEFPTEYQLIISNTCNLKCRTCSPSHSTKWLKEAGDLHRIPRRTEPYRGPICEDSSVLWQTRKDWMVHITDLDIVGGEPFYIKEWEQLWREFEAMGQSKKINLGISSNCTIFNGELVQFLIDNFRYTGIGLSIDGIGKQFEYLRHPGNWAVAKSNIDAYYALHTAPENEGRYRNMFTHTVSWMNIWYLPVFHQFVYENWPKITIWNNVVHGPAYFSPWALPEPVKDAVRSRINAFPFEDRYRDDIAGILNIMDSRKHDEQTWYWSKRTIKESDAYRRESLAASVPEFFDILAPYWD
jgi:MoaA/NifB/PqqE/SkfB family radical SAM enzyme